MINDGRMMLDDGWMDDGLLMDRGIMDEWRDGRLWMMTDYEWIMEE